MSNNQASYKNINLACMIAITLSVVYFFVYFLPNNLNSQFLYQKQVDCYKHGSSYTNNLEKDLDEMTTVINFKSYYNRDLEKCFYSGGTLSPKVMQKFILDLYLNKEIISHFHNAEISETIGASKDEFDLKEYELFKLDQQ